MRSLPILAVSALALPLHALDISGYVVNKLGAPIAGAQVCIKSDAASCVTTGTKGQFRVAKAIAIRPQGQGIVGFSVAYRGGSLIVRSPEAASARMEWLSAGGRRVWAATDVKLAAGNNAFALPSGLPHAGMCILRLSTPDHVLAWKAVLAPGASASGDAAAPAAPRIAALSKTAAATLEFTKAGYRTRTYSPLQEDETDVYIQLSQTGDSGISFEGALNLKVIAIDRAKKTMITEATEGVCDTAADTVVHETYRDTITYLIREGKLWTWYPGDCIGQMFTGSASDIVGSWTLSDPNALLPEDIRAGCTSDSGTGPSSYESFNARYTITETRVIVDIVAEMCPNDLFEPFFYSILGQDTAVLPTKNTCLSMTLKNGKAETATVEYSKKADSLRIHFAYKALSCDAVFYFGITPKDPTCPEGEEIVPFVDCVAGSGFANLGILAKTSAAAPALPMSRDPGAFLSLPRWKGLLAPMRNALPAGDYISRAWMAAHPGK